MSCVVGECRDATPEEERAAMAAMNRAAIHSAAKVWTLERRRSSTHEDRLTVKIDNVPTGFGLIQGEDLFEAGLPNSEWAVRYSQELGAAETTVLPSG